MDSIQQVFQAAITGDVNLLRDLIASGVDVNATVDGGQTALIAAASRGRVEATSLLLHAGADVNASNENSHTALTEAAWEGHTAIARLLLKAGAASMFDLAFNFAVRRGHVEIVEMLMKAGANVNATDDAGLTPLMEAIENKHPEIVRRLLASGADINARMNDGNTALAMAAFHGDRDLVRSFLGAGAEVNPPPGSAHTPLAAAASSGHLEIARSLIQCGADLSAVDGILTWTPLMHAVERKKSKMVELLLEAGSPLEIRDQYGKTALYLAAEGGSLPLVRRLLKASASVDCRDNQGWTPFMTAAWSCHHGIMKMLIESGADVNAVDEIGETALLRSVVAGETKTTRFLVEHGSDTNARFSQPTPYDRTLKGATALMVAARDGRLDLVRILVSAGADVTIKDARGRTALGIAVTRGNADVVDHLRQAGASESFNRAAFQRASLLKAAESGNIAKVRELLNSGTPMNTSDKEGFTPLMKALAGDHDSLVQLLLERGADPNVKTKYGMGPLHAAIEKGKASIALELIRAGADVNSRAVGMYACTPLIGAALLGNLELVEQLLAAGADVDSSDDRGRSALLYAAMSRHYGIVQQLLQVNATVDQITADFLKPLRFEERASQPDYRRAVDELSDLCGALASKLKPIPGGYYFVTYARERTRDLMKSGIATHEVVAGYMAEQEKVDAILERVRDDFQRRGFTAFDMGFASFTGSGHAVGLLPTADKYAVIAAISPCCNDGERGAVEIIAWLREMETKNPFVLTGCRFDTVSVMFPDPVVDPERLAERMYEFCSDMVDQGTGTVETLAKQLREQRKATFWWD